MKRRETSFSPQVTSVIVVPASRVVSTEKNLVPDPSRGATHLGHVHLGHVPTSVTWVRLRAPDGEVLDEKSR